MTWTAVCTWEDGWWTVTIPGSRNAHTQAKRLELVPARVCEVLKLTDGVDVDPADVELETHVAGEDVLIADTILTRRDAEQVKAQADKFTLWAVSRLHNAGLPYRDIAQLVGISRERARQIATAHEMEAAS